MRCSSLAIVSLLVAGCATPGTKSPAAPPRQADAAVVEAERAVRAVDELNRGSRDCLILKHSRCCWAFEAVKRTDESSGPRPPEVTYWSDPDCSEGPPGRAPRGPVLCFGQRVP